ncbi:MAG: hypothetical protein RIB03_04175 [Henriciella sp.]|uniref:hypothetical protein n=1 Tax=Henriciella sp. TaxID=1968823 RepID=UPI002635A1F8|nr:hypothetical protein [Henriciella sp.]
MSDQNDTESADVLEALDRVLEELRREFKANPAFAHRVVRALGANVVFDPKHAAVLINPVELLSKETPERAKETLSGLAPAELKKMAKASKLATPTDMSGKSKEALVEMILRRADLRLQSRQSDV